jgi:hypothetical protein
MRCSAVSAGPPHIQQTGEGEVIRLALSSPMCEQAASVKEQLKSAPALHSRVSDVVVKSLILVRRARPSKLLDSGRNQRAGLRGFWARAR